MVDRQTSRHGSRAPDPSESKAGGRRFWGYSLLSDEYAPRTRLPDAVEPQGGSEPAVGPVSDVAILRGRTSHYDRRRNRQCETTPPLSTACRMAQLLWHCPTRFTLEGSENARCGRAVTGPGRRGPLTGALLTLTAGQIQRLVEVKSIVASGHRAERVGDREVLVGHSSRLRGIGRIADVDDRRP